MNITSPLKSYLKIVERVYPFLSTNIRNISIMRRIEKYIKEFIHHIFRKMSRKLIYVYYNAKDVIKAMNKNKHKIIVWDEGKGFQGLKSKFSLIFYEQLMKYLKE
jgi:hypothetical protein